MQTEPLDLELADEDERFIRETEIAHLDKIFLMPLKTKEDLLKLAELTDAGEEYEQ